MTIWTQMKHSFITRMDRANSSVELRNLSDRALRDIGLTRRKESCYSASPFWMRGFF
jgi:uncharacterized protein YjiS (DUF1127 family)